MQDVIWLSSTSSNVETESDTRLVISLPQMYDPNVSMHKQTTRRSCAPRRKAGVQSYRSTQMLHAPSKRIAQSHTNKAA